MRVATLAVAALLVAPPAAAHHDGAPAAGGLDDAVGALPLAGLAAAPQSRLAFTARYLRLADREPSYLLPVDDPGDHLAALEASLTHAWSPRVAMTVGLPLVVRAPGPGEDGDVDVGPGDLRLGTRTFPWIAEDRQSSLSTALDLSFPSGGRRSTEPDATWLGAGDVVGRLSILGVVGLGALTPAAREWRITLEAGLASAPRQDANVVVDAGGSVSWTPLSWLGLFADARTRVYLRSEPVGLSVPQNLPRGAGDAVLVLTPGLSIAPTDDVRISGGPQLPVTAVRDFAIAGALGVAVAL